MRRIRFLLFCDALTVLCVALAWTLMFVRAEGGLFSERSLASLRYFTVDSNLLMGLCALVCLVFDIRALRCGDPGAYPARADIFRHTGVVAVMITFLVVVFFLGPVFGYGGMFIGGNFFFHGFNPLLALAVYLFVRLPRRLPRSTILYGLLPMVLYGVYYVGNILLNGLLRPDGSSRDFYGFLGGDVNRFPLAFGILLLADLAISLTVYLLGRKKE